MISSGEILGQGQVLTPEGKNLKVRRLVRDVLGKTISLNFFSQESISGILISANGTEFVMEVQGVERTYPTQSIRSYTIKAGIGEGVLVLISGCFAAGLGAGAAALSIDGISASAVGGVGFTFGLLGLWLGVESFFQDVEVELP